MAPWAGAEKGWEPGWERPPEPSCAWGETGKAYCLVVYLHRFTFVPQPFCSELKKSPEKCFERANATWTSPRLCWGPRLVWQSSRVRTCRTCKVSAAGVLQHVSLLCTAGRVVCRTVRCQGTPASNNMTRALQFHLRTWKFVEDRSLVV